MKWTVLRWAFATVGELNWRIWHNALRLPPPKAFQVARGEAANHGAFEAAVLGGSGGRGGGDESGRGGRIKIYDLL